MPTTPKLRARILGSSNNVAYLQDMLRELKQLANRGDQPFLAYLIEMAAAEAARVAQQR